MKHSQETNKRRIHRLAPCPSYDVEGLESWLSEMAQKGWMLEQDGILLGFFTFSACRPQKMRYRLDAAQKQPSLWAEDDGRPRPEELELNEAYDWEYVDHYGDFYIYRSASADTREMHTDPELHAMTLNAVKSRRRVALFQTFFFLVLYPVLLWWPRRISVIHFVLGCGTWLALCFVLLALLIVAGALWELAALSRYQKKLRGQEVRQKRTNAAGQAARRYVVLTVEIVLVAASVFGGVHRWYASAMGENQIPLREYEGTVPFATLADFAGPMAQDYRPAMENVQVYGNGFNTVELSHDPLAPRMIEWRERADVTQQDGTVLSGIYTVRYYEMRTQWLAERLVKGIGSEKRHEKGFAEKPAPDIDAQDVMAYELYSEQLLFRKGNIVVHAEMVRMYEPETEKDESWMHILAESINAAAQEKEHGG